MTIRKIAISLIVLVLTTVGLIVFSTDSTQNAARFGYKAESNRFLALKNAEARTAVVIKNKYKKGEKLSPKELKSILYTVGFRGEALKTAWATAMKESTGRPRSHNKNSQTGDNSYGLFQINMIGSLGPARLKQFDLEKNGDLFNPIRNAEIAFFMSNGGKNWSAWGGVSDRTLFWMKKFPK
jgi:hypothetical protein